MHNLLEFYGGVFSLEKTSSSEVLSFNKAKEKQPIRSNHKLLSQFLQHRRDKDFSEKQNDLDKYHTAEPVNPLAPNFEILAWWKINNYKNKILAQIAQDVLVVPVSTTASKSAFSTGGPVLDSLRSSLSPKMVKALVCTQN